MTWMGGLYIEEGDIISCDYCETQCFVEYVHEVKVGEFIDNVCEECLKNKGVTI